MRLRIIFFAFLISLSACASEDSEVRDLFNRYERVVSGHEIHLIEDVFSAKFLKDSGGKDEFIEKVKSEPKISEKSFPKTDVTWRKGESSEILLAKLSPKTSHKGKSTPAHNDFLLVRENGKLKIDGTVGDAN